MLRTLPEVEASDTEMSATNITSQILAIQRDQSLTDAEKAVKRQALLSGKWVQPTEDASKGRPLPPSLVSPAGWANQS